MPTPRAQPMPKRADFPSEQERQRGDSVTRQLRTIALLEGKLITGLRFNGNVSVVVYHGLARQPRGWFIVDLTRAAGITGDLRRFSWDENTMTLINDDSSDITVSLWVF